MQIRHMNATFGKLHHDTLNLGPGFNIIYAPNESGKSTWCSFLRTMLYGFPRRERGVLAEKNRFAPWDGTPMSGTLELEQAGRRCTITRTTSRANAPMGDFSCTYTGTTDAVPGIDAENCGEELLGVERSVYLRSAFISQSGLAVDQDAQLERRIASLITTGDEADSYTESYDRLKKQRNRRRHNKTGLLPALDDEISQLDDSLIQYDSLSSQLLSAQTQSLQAAQRVEDLQKAQEQYRQLALQDTVRKWRSAQAQADAARDVCLHLQQRDAALPSEQELNAMLGTADALERSIREHDDAYEESRRLREEAARAQEAWQAHPLYPAREADLNASPSAPDAASFSPWLYLLSPAAGLAACAAAVWASVSPLAAAALGLGTAAVLFVILYSIRRRRSGHRSAAVPSADIQTYLELLHQARAADESAQASASAALRLHHSCQDNTLLLLSRVQPFQPQAMDLKTSRTAIHDALHRWEEQSRAEKSAQDAEFQARLLESHLPEGPLPAWDAELPHPIFSQIQLENALPRAISQQQEAQSRLERLTGQRDALGSRDSLQRTRDEKELQRRELQREYDAITAAMDALDAAHTELQSRFSPALGDKAAGIFSLLTGGRYDSVLLDRDFSLSARMPDDVVSRSIHLLSQGAADQLYLAVRLAVCDMVLPEDKAAPLILDDALCSFDDHRMALALDYLTQLSKGRQILLFTCQKREVEYLQTRENVTVIRL